ncbi:MAG: chromate efflux transporter [bacterium]
MIVSPQKASRPAVPLKTLALVFLKIGSIGFGGGPGMLAIIRQEVVEKRKWIGDEELSTAVAMGQMLPGPFVTNYAEYIGYRLAGLKGMVCTATAVLLPGFVLVCALGFLYFRYGTLPIITRIFTGIQPVIVGILGWATWSIGRSNIKSWRSVLIGLIAAIALFFKGDVLFVILGCGVLGIVLSGVGRTRISKLMTIAPLPLLFTLGTFVSSLEKAGELTLIFFKMGTVIFGGGFAAIPFLQHEVVQLRGWLTMSEFIDAVALGQMTPGPVAIMSTFIGFKVFGIPGALIATIGTFLPSALMLLALIHIYNRIKQNPWTQAFLGGVMPAVCGLLFVSTIFIAKTTVTGIIPALIAVVTLISLVRLRIEPLWLIFAGAIFGLVLP